MEKDRKGTENMKKMQEFDIENAAYLSRSPSGMEKALRRGQSQTGAGRLAGLVAVAVLSCLTTLRAEIPPPSQIYYVPFPGNFQLEAFRTVNTDAVDPLAVFVTIACASDNTVIWYDEWEDGYEANITNPQQATTKVFGDGNSANGFPPGNPSDLIPAGTVFNLRNFLSSTNLQAVIDYDARDKIASHKPISITKTTFPAVANTLMAGCVEMFEFGLWDNHYRCPVGVNMPTTTEGATFTFDQNIFDITDLWISAGPTGATVRVDKDNNGVFELTNSLSEGQGIWVTNVNVGGQVVADNPVQVILFTGESGSAYGSRDTSLLPTNRWSSSYYVPVSTPNGNATVVFLYNAAATNITVSYDYRNSTSSYVTASIVVPAGGNRRVELVPTDATHFGAYKFYTTGAVPPRFYAFCAVDADDVAGNNQAWDGGFTLIGKESLSTQVLLSLGIGRDPFSLTNPSENGNPLWITTVGNSHTQTVVYVDYNGDNAGLLTDPNGNKYDAAYSLRELQQQKLFDPDLNQSGMLVYTLDANVKIAAAWTQDPLVASASAPGLDVATVVPPLREGDAGKSSTLATDADGDGYYSAGDTLQYDIRVINTARSPIPGPFTVRDVLPADTVYVAGSTKYRFSVAGVWQDWVAVSDNGVGTAFPLDVDGFADGLAISGTLGFGQQIELVFQATVDLYPDLTPGTKRIINTGTVEISPYGVIIKLYWEDLLYGSIGDRVWNDLDGDGVQDGGEAGISNIVVFLDLNTNGVRDLNEPWDTTGSNGIYTITGLLGGSYLVRVNPSSIAAVNPGYGPTYDLTASSLPTGRSFSSPLQRTARTWTSASASAPALATACGRIRTATASRTPASRESIMYGCFSTAIPMGFTTSARRIP